MNWKANDDRKKRIRRMNGETATRRQKKNTKFRKIEIKGAKK